MKYLELQAFKQEVANKKDKSAGRKMSL